MLVYASKYITLKFQFIIAAAKSLQSCPTLCDPIDGSPPGSAVLGIVQARTLEWVAISFSSPSLPQKWKVKVKSLSPVRLFVIHELQPTRLLRPWDLPGKSTRVGCHCLLQHADANTLMTESKEELKSLLMKMKEESEKTGWKLNIQKTKIMASAPITSWQIEGKRNCDKIYFLGLQNHCRLWLQPRS